MAPGVDEIDVLLRIGTAIIAVCMCVKGARSQLLFWLGAQFKDDSKGSRLRGQPRIKEKAVSNLLKILQECEYWLNRLILQIWANVLQNKRHF